MRCSPSPLWPPLAAFREKWLLPTGVVSLSALTIWAMMFNVERPEVIGVLALPGMLCVFAWVLQPVRPVHS